MHGGNVTAKVQRHRFSVLLAVLLTSIIVQSFGTTGLVSDAVRLTLGVMILVVIFRRPRERAVMCGLFAILVVLGAWRYHAPASDVVSSILMHGTISLFLFAAAWVVVRDLFGGTHPGPANVLGAICGYLAAGDAWAGVNAIAYLLAPTAFSVDPAVVPMIADWQGRTALFSYYSFAQMLTINYADITPVRAPATTISLLSTLFGLFYTAVVVSQLVGMAQARREH